jgi:D-glycero-alpha-D-manno-heptose-7-phosphate kinase
MDILGEPIGKQDQYASAFGSILELIIDQRGNVEVSPLNISYSTLEELENNLLMFSTGIKRSATEIITNQKKEVENDEEKMKQMHFIKEIGLETKKCLEEGNVQKFGRWLNVHWETKRKFSNKMSSDQIDNFYQKGIENGALGGKLIGAGGGGFLLFYCDKNKKQLREALLKEGLKELPFRLDADGCKLIYQS